MEFSLLYGVKLPCFVRLSVAALQGPAGVMVGPPAKNSLDTSYGIYLKEV